MTKEKIREVVEKIFYSPASNGKAEESINNGIELIQSLLTPSADVQERAKELQWVKASERMPAKEGRTVVKRLRECMMADATLRNDGSMVFTTPNNMTWNRYKEFEWLDESGASSMQGEVERLREENEKLKASINEVEERENNPYWYWPQCDVENCDGVSGCNGMYWKETGYWCLCSKHSTEGREGKPQPTMKAAAIEREKSRDGNGCLTNQQ